MVKVIAVIQLLFNDNDLLFLKSDAIVYVRLQKCKDCPLI